MVKVTPKENWMKYVGGGTPEYIPYYAMMGDEYLGESAVKGIMANIFPNNMFEDGGYDMWGVRHVAAYGTNNATMPDVRNILLHEIDDWKDVVKFPEKPATTPDYKKMYDDSVKMMRIDRTQSAVHAGPNFMPFQELMGLMGFEGGLIALVEDPDTVSSLFVGDGAVDNQHFIAASTVSPPPRRFPFHRIFHLCSLHRHSGISFGISFHLNGVSVLVDLLHVWNLHFECRSLVFLHPEGSAPTVCSDGESACQSTFGELEIDISLAELVGHHVFGGHLLVVGIPEYDLQFFSLQRIRLQTSQAFVSYQTDMHLLSRPVYAPVRVYRCIGLNFQRPGKRITPIPQLL